MSLRSDYLFDIPNNLWKKTILNLSSWKIKNFHELLFWIKSSKFFLTDLMKKSEISIHPQANKLTHFVTYIFDFCFLSNKNFYRFFFNHSKNLYLNFIFPLFFCFNRKNKLIRLMINIFPKLNLCGTKDCLSLFWFLFLVFLRTLAKTANI